MIGKLLALLALAAPTIALAEAVPSPFFIEMANIEKLSCGSAVGSGVRIDGDIVLTAYHVIDGRICTIDGGVVEVATLDAPLDFAAVRSPSKDDTRMPFSCDGFKPGRAYFAVGFAFGERLIVQRLNATQYKSREKLFLGEDVLRGRIFPGMSGGAIVDEDGQIVGIINGGNQVGTALSRSLAETYICQGAK